MDTYKVCSFHKTKEEAYSNKTAKVLRSRRAGRNGSPEDHANREVDGRLSEFIENQIRRDCEHQLCSCAAEGSKHTLHQEISNKEDTDASLHRVSLSNGGMKRPT